MCNNVCYYILQTVILLGVTVPTISVVILYGQLQQKPDSVIVLDCRPRSQQENCHVDYKQFPQWIEIPEETINSG